MAVKEGGLWTKIYSDEIYIQRDIYTATWSLVTKVAMPREGSYNLSKLTGGN